MAEGWTKMVFLPTDAPRMSKWLSQGAQVSVVACRKCGLLHMYTDVEKVEEMTGEGETRVANQSAHVIAQPCRGLVGSQPVYYLWQESNHKRV